MPHRRPTLLVLDDEADSCRALCAVLEDAGYACESFSDPLRALARLAAGGIDLLVADQGLPLMDGRRVVEAARTRGEPLPAILVGEQPVTGLGGVLQVTRPVQGRVLVSAADRLLGRSARRARG